MPLAITPEGTYPSTLGPDDVLHVEMPPPAPPPPPKRGTVAHLVAHLVAPDDTWERAYRIEHAAPRWARIDVPCATANAVANDILAYYSNNQGDDDAPAASLISAWVADTLLECPIDTVNAIDGYNYYCGTCDGFSWRASEREDGFVYLDFRPAEDDVEAWLIDLRCEDDDLRGVLCGVCHTARPDQDIDNMDGCLLDSASRLCPACGAEYEEGTGYLERTVACPHCQGDAVWVPAHGDAPGHDACILCHAVCDLDPTHGPTWGPPAPEYLSTWTVRPHEYR